MRRGAPLLASLALLASLGVFAASHFAVTTDITAFLPAGEDRDLLAISRKLADSELSRTMVLTVEAPDTAQAIQASQALEQALRARPEVANQLAFLEGGPPVGVERAVYDLYHPRRLGFLAASAEQARERLDDAALRRAARALRAQLAQPMSPLVARLAPSDPLLILTGLFDKLQDGRGDNLRVEQGRFLTEDGRHAVLFLGTRARAFDSAAQAPVLRGLRAAFEEVNARHGGRLRLDQSGVNRFAVRTEQTIKADIQRVSVLSVVGLTLLLVWLFRSLRLVALAALPLGAGVLAGVSTSLWLYGRVHGVTLAFGASLLGVAIDYVVHLYCHHAVSPDPRGAAGALRAIGPSLLTGAATTLVGFAALAGAGFGGLREVALFASAGLTAALGMTFFALPALLPDNHRPVAARAKLLRRLEAWLGRLRAARHALWALPALAVAFAALGLPKVTLSDDFMRVDQLDPALLAEDERVRARVTRFDQQRFVVALGATEEQALQVNEGVAEALRASRAAGELDGFRNIASLLPSAATQRAVSDAVRRSPQLAARLAAAFEREGFREGALAPFAQVLQAPVPPPLRYADLASSPLAPLVRPFRVAFENRVGFVSFLHGVRDAGALRARLARLPGAAFVEQGAQLRAAHRDYQRRALRWLAVGLVAVLALLALRYRDLRRVVAAFVPSVLGAAVTVGALALTGHGLDLVVLTALLMVVSMGVDYGVFLVDAERAQRPAAALLSVVVAALSTVLGFGLLALSQHPLLRSIGLTATVGMVASLVLAPTTLVLAGRPRPAPRAARLSEET